MNEINCENALMAKMAEMDGEETSISSEQIHFHLADCENCRREFEQMLVADNLLKRQVRLEQTAELWSAIENQISTKKSSGIGWQPFVLLGVFLVAYKLLEMLPSQDSGLAFKFIPLAFIVALFVFLKENPFKIKTRLAQEEI